MNSNQNHLPADQDPAFKAQVQALKDVTAILNESAKLDRQLSNANHAEASSVMGIIEQVYRDSESNGICSVGASAVLRAMMPHWKNHLSEGHGWKIITSDIDDVKAMLDLLQSEIEKKCIDLNVSQSNCEPKTTLQIFMERLEKATSITIDNGSMLIDWESGSIEGVDENWIVSLHWSDDEFDFAVNLDEGGISKGHFEAGGTFVCDDSEGDEVEIRFFVSTALNS